MFKYGDRLIWISSYWNSDFIGKLFIYHGKENGFDVVRNSTTNNKYSSPKLEEYLIPEEIYNSPLYKLMQEEE